MCLTLSIVTLTIAATRIHRGLVAYASVECTEQYDITPSHFSLRSHRCRSLFDPIHSKANGLTEWKINRVPITRAQAQLSRMEVAIPEMYEQDETLQMSQHGSARSLIDVEGQLYERPAGLPRPVENVENGVTGVGSPTESPLT